MVFAIRLKSDYSQKADYLKAYLIIHRTHDEALLYKNKLISIQDNFNAKIK